LFSGDRVKYIGASVVVEADNRYLLEVMYSHFGFIDHLSYEIFFIAIFGSA
jgi:hypothetical protein